MCLKTKMNVYLSYTHILYLPFGSVYLAGSGFGSLKAIWPDLVPDGYYR